MAGRGRSITLRERVLVAGRAVSAAGGGYGLAALAAGLPSPARPEAAATAAFAGFVLMPTGAVIVIARRSLQPAAPTRAGAALRLGGMLRLPMRGAP